MRTDKITIRSNGEGMQEALEQVEKFITYIQPDKKTGIALRLLTEETLSMVRAITGDFTARFWVENSHKKVARIHLEAKAYMDHDQRRELLSTSTTGKNDPGKGVMMKIKRMFENALYHIEEVDELYAPVGGMPVVYLDQDSAAAYTYIWTLDEYKASVEEKKENDAEAEEAWDELEKSIIAGFADDVKVGISGNIVQMVVEKALE